MPYGQKSFKIFSKSIALRAEIWGVHLAVHCFVGTLRVEIIEIHSTFSRHGYTQASLASLIWLNEKVQKLRLKIYQKSS